MDITTSEYEIIGAILHGQREMFETVYLVEHLRAEDLPTMGEVYKSIETLYASGMTITPENLTSNFSKSELQYLKDTFYGDERSVRASCRFLITDTERRKLLGKVQGAEKRLVKEGVDPEGVIKELSEALKVTRINEVFQTHVSEIVSRTESEVILSPTRLTELDRLLNGGLRTRRLVVIGGRQKGRKTTVIREVSLSLLFDPKLKPRDKVNIVFMCFENDQWSTTWDFVGSLAAKILDSQGRLDEKANLLSSEILMEAYPRSRVDRAAPFFQWPTDIQKAVERAVTLIAEANLFIYDRSKEGGKLSDVDSIERVIASHGYNFLKEGQHPIFVIDYAQLVKHNSDLYIHMSNLSSQCIEWVNKYGCTIVCLSQFNEAYNKETASGVQTDYIGTKGGGDLESACHTYITTGYNSDTPDRLSIHVKRQRRGGTGNFDVRIHPTTGHIR